MQPQGSRNTFEIVMRVDRLLLCMAVALIQALLSNPNGVVRVCDLGFGMQAHNIDASAFPHGTTWEAAAVHRSDIMDASPELRCHDPPSLLPAERM